MYVTLVSRYMKLETYAGAGSRGHDDAPRRMGSVAGAARLPGVGGRVLIWNGIAREETTSRGRPGGEGGRLGQHTVGIGADNNHDQPGTTRSPRLSALAVSWGYGSCVGRSAMEHGGRYWD